jgi:ATP-dependent helicase/nuclease subunit A
MTNIKIIGAGAGTGKTFRLSQEVSDAVLKRGVRPANIVITTFTRKAASELLSRVGQMLIKNGAPRQANLLRQALIGTINGVCGSLLERFAFHAGLAVRQRVITEDEEKMFFSKAMSQTITPELSMEMEELDRIMSSAGKRSDDDRSWQDHVEKIAKTARMNRIMPEALKNQWAGKSISMITDTLGAPQGSLKQCVTEAKRACAEIEAIVQSGQDTQKNTAAALEFLRTFISTSGKGNAVPWQNFQKLATLSAGKRGVNADSHLHNLRLLAADHCTWPEFRESIERYIQRIFESVATAIDQYQKFKTEMGLIDFTDQETLTLDLLEKNEEARALLKEQLDLVLVDEFQDTSPVQLALFLRLAELAKESVWVGDPKQAIYGFRGTDPELMIEAVRALVPGGKKSATERLSTSFRSAAPLVEFVNTTFKNAFASQGIQPDEVPLVPNRKDKVPFPRLESWVITEATKKDSEASAIAARIRTMLASPKRYMVLRKDATGPTPLAAADIAVLCRTNPDCDLVAAALEAQGISAERAASGVLATPEMQLVLSYLRLMAAPEDTLAAAKLSYLDEVFCKNGDPAAWLEHRLDERELQEKMEKGQDGKYGGWHGNALVDKAREASADRSRMTPYSALLHAMEMTSVRRVSARNNGPARAQADLDRLIRFAKEYEESALHSGDALTVAGLLAWFDQLAKDEADTTGMSGTDAVTVSTYHGAKGLEWPFVVLWSLNNGPWPRFFDVSAFMTAPFNAQSPLADRGIRFIPNPYGKGDSISTFHTSLADTDAFQKSEASDDQEMVRLLYVIMTRPRDYLAFAAKPGKFEALEQLAGLMIPQTPSSDLKEWNVVQTTPDDTETAAPEKSVWYAYADTKTEHKPAEIQPSALELPENVDPAALIKGQEDFCERMKTTGDYEPDAFGTAVHRYLAIDTSKCGADDKKMLAERLLKGYNQEKIVLPEELVRTGDALVNWINKKWPGCTLHHEWPIAVERDAGVIEGFSDLVVELADEFAIIDYKTFPGSHKQITERAGTYAPQLDAYAEAVEKAIKKKCVGMFVCYPVSGVMVEIQN